MIPGKWTNSPKMVLFYLQLLKSGRIRLAVKLMTFYYVRKTIFLSIWVLILEQSMAETIAGYLLVH